MSADGCQAAYSAAETRDGGVEHWTGDDELIATCLFRPSLKGGNEYDTIDVQPS